MGIYRIKAIVKYSIMLFFIFLVTSCNLVPQVAVVTVRNYSNADVKDFVISYQHASTGELQAKRINLLSKGESKTLTLELTSSSMAIGAGIAVVPAEIEYYINGIQFDMDNGVGGISLSGATFVIIITDSGWSFN